MYRVASNRTLDFGLAMTRIVRAKSYAKADKDLAITAMPEIEILVNDILEEISVAKMELLKKFVTIYYFDNLLMHFSYEEPTKSLDALLETFEAQSPERFFNELNDLMLRGKPLSTRETTEEAIKAAIERTNGNNPVQNCMSFKTYKQLKANPKEAQDLFLECLRYFKPIYEAFEVRIEAIRAIKFSYFEAQFEMSSQAQKIDNLVAFNDPKVEAFPKIVYLSVFLDKTICMDVSEAKACITVVFGISLESIFEERDLDQEILKCLADPTKMEMLKIIKSHEVCAKDLVSLMKLSKSNISHHIGKLSYAELISIQMKEGNKAYYAVNVERIEGVFGRVLGSIKG